ncbi:MAG: NADH-quinone oxidoreductase subunit L [Bacteroidota bacterium]|nr:NADH-quinone oxidoreductase subunit L [Bacteroidota bacterium]
MLWLLCGVLLTPILLFLLLQFASGWSSVFIGIISSIFIIIGLFFSVLLIYNFQKTGPIEYTFNWFKISNLTSFSGSLEIQKYAVLMCLIVYLVALPVTLFSIEYKKHDSGTNKYFGYLGLFVFAMMGIVFSSNFLITFIFWELVGFASYLLIGFLFDKPKAVQAALKAFMVNKIADMFFLAALLLIWSTYGTFSYNSLFQLIGSYSANYWIGFCLLIGCIGKSAQIPFSIWLPDAMEGPTPISALIHAATMVAAGIFVLVRLSILISPDVLHLAAIIGTVTAFLGAFFALTQYDIKKILAFSTISQLGYMLAGIGFGAFEQSFFHLATHAFFKAGLFLCAGSVILSLHHAHQKMETLDASLHFDKQDIRSMGGLWKFLPWTCIAFILCAFSLIGLPFFSGFVSKEMLLQSMWDSADNQFFGNKKILLYILFITVIFTAFYMTRMLIMVFGGKLRIQSLLQKFNVTIEENNWVILVSIFYLALMAISISPIILYIFDFMNLKSHMGGIMPIITLLCVFLGLGLSLLVYHPLKAYQPKKMKDPLLIGLYKASFHQMYLDKYLLLMFTKFGISGSNIAFYIEGRIINRVVDWFGILQVVIAHCIYFIEKYIVDGFVSFVTRFIKFFGYLGSKLMNGKLQFYMLIFVFIILFFIIINYLI